MPTLHWLDRARSVRQSRDVPCRLLRAVDQYSCGQTDSGNLLIQGDNLAALKALLPYYRGQVKCVFIDPPYNTRSAFEHYQDSLEHSQWLDMMYPRLELLRELLAEDGSIWVTIDDHEAHYLKVVTDEIFGRGNFVRNIVWQKKYTVASDSKGIPDSHDHILVYRKSEKMQRGLLPRTEKQNSLYKYNDDDGLGFYRTDNLSVKAYSENYDYEIKNPKTGKGYFPPSGRCWMTSKERVEKLVSENRIFFGKNGAGAPQLKRYLDEVQQGVVPTSWWPYDEVGHNDESRKEIKKLGGDDFFSTPKPERLIKRILELATQEGDLVLDSFLGSGTTAAVAHKMNRRTHTAWLLFDLDFAGSAHQWQDVNLPPPTYIVINPANGHAQYGYLLHTPVCMTYNARDAPKGYLKAIRDAYIEMLNADRCFTGVKVKNPVHPDWLLWLPSTDCLRYELGDLAEYVDLSGRTCNKSRTRQEQTEYAELGRNCWLFVELGMKACHLVRKFWHGGRYEAFETHMCLLAEQLNATLSNPMRFNEVRSIARSKARWT